MMTIDKLKDLTQRELVVFDFDETLVDCNSDSWIHQLAPDNQLPEHLEYRPGQDYLKYVQTVLLYLHDQNVNKEDFKNCLSLMPSVPGMLETLVETLTQQPDNYDMIIISDSNSFFIESYLKARSLENSFTSIITNPARFSENGQLIIDEYHIQDYCSMSARNLCKGEALKNFIGKRMLDNNTVYTCINYVGDGENDLCPSTKLTSRDRVFPRRGYPLERLCNKLKLNSELGDQNEVGDEDSGKLRLNLEANIVPWTTGDEILSAIIGTKREDTYDDDNNHESTDKDDDEQDEEDGDTRGERRPRANVPENRIERSNSCSQAQTSSNNNVPSYSPSVGFGATTSVSHDNLADRSREADTLCASAISDHTAPNSSASNSNLHSVPLKASEGEGIETTITSAEESLRIAIVDTAARTAAAASATLGREASDCKATAPPAAPIATPSAGIAQSDSFSSSAKFFSSKLNTGSLWSLLSVGSNNSTNVAHEMAPPPSASNDSPDSSSSSSVAAQRYPSSIGSDSSSSSTSSGISTGTCSSIRDSNDLTQLKGKTTIKGERDGTNKLGGFLSQVQSFKRNIQQQASPNIMGSNQVERNKPKDMTSSRILDPAASTTEATALVVNNNPVNLQERKRLRFNLKYIGSAMLHKNFTLPMLEWIAKDIRRQTIRGAQSTSQRQFTIPARDILLEIQTNQLTAVSCKDGHCIFVHPMHCVSKYAQLQYDPTCFSYLIRDTKDAPLFCHVFQARSVNKVHDIFKAIRETATRTQVIHQPLAPIAASPEPQVDGGSKSTRPSQAASTPSANQVPLNRLQSNLMNKQPSSQSQQQQQQHQPPSTSAATNSNNTFEGSYQFEVMFVKKVKLQCRRVPASFVDDALETLKSFEVLRSTCESKSQIKGVGKRIISASVDERQEYDESCQSPTPGSGPSNLNSNNNPPTLNLKQPAADTIVPSSKSTDDDGQRRGSCVSLHKSELTARDERESRSCQQSPTKMSATNEPNGSDKEGGDSTSRVDPKDSMKKHQSIDCLKSLDYTIRSARDGKAPSYANDFSPYNTITSSDLNKRIAAIPVVSSSVSLDHETRQKLARQVRETIMATAANIKKDVYASGDKLDSSASSKALDSLSCTATSYSPPGDDKEALAHQNNDATKSIQQQQSKIGNFQTTDNQGVEALWSMSADQRRSSDGNTTQAFSSHHLQQQQQQSSNNFDLFRRASARQVIKNRTMLLLIGKEDLCAISIDKHQMLFSKSFSAIVHCLQGNNNKDHFGLICRDSGKINPNAESYAGFVFKCQSDKVVREIMGALKQVIYSSQHNYHGYNSPYNPLNAVALNKFKPSAQTSGLDNRLNSDGSSNNGSGNSSPNSVSGQQLSLAAKRGFANPIEVEEAARRNRATLYHQSSEASGATSPQTKPRSGSSTAGAIVSSQQTSSMPIPMVASISTATAVASQPKNLIKSMFCDNCPLYWFHRLCCDIESLPVEASKAIILRRIDSSLTEKEQDELYSRFSEFNIDSVDEHNEIFMSLLRQQCERKQSRHCQTSAHVEAMNKNLALIRQQQHPSVSRQSSFQKDSSALSSSTSHGSQLQSAGSEKSGSSTGLHYNPHHQRSGSSSGSLAFVIGQSSANQASQSIADASSVAIDNLMKAKNSISSSIENMLKRRSSMRDQLDEQLQIVSSLPSRSGSFKNTSRESRANDLLYRETNELSSGGFLKRSQSTSDYPNSSNSSTTTESASAFQGIASTNWRESLSRTLNDDLANYPLVGLFQRRNSQSQTRTNSTNQQPRDQLDTNKSSINHNEQQSSSSLKHSQDTQKSKTSIPTTNTDSRLMCPSRASVQQQQTLTYGGGSSSSMLSSAFWKKSIFDKIKQPLKPTGDEQASLVSVKSSASGADQNKAVIVSVKSPKESEMPVRKRTREELRSLWRKAIIEQITLLKMEKQNQRLMANAVEYDLQRVKLDYQDMIYTKDVPFLWDKLLKQDPTKKVEFAEVARLVKRGVPKQRRGEIWMFLMNQYQLRHGTSFQSADSEYHGDANQNYRSLLSQLSTQQHEIFVDIGRTFPSHPYYSQYLGIGQLSLFNLLKAYSLLDQEVGYCQGLSFVAGILLLHVNTEDEAFELMRHLLFNFGLRKQYLPSMDALHLQLYQLTRLLRDHEYDLFNHFDHYDISPSLYAAPWFLTLFASQFPLGFVARLFDLISLIGIEAIFRVSLNLLAYHRTSVLACASLESTMEYMKSNLVKIDEKNLVYIFDKSMALDLRNKLIEYEIEYTFYCAEDRARSSTNSGRTANTTTLQNQSLPKATNQHCIGNSEDVNKPDNQTTRTDRQDDFSAESTSQVAEATATVIIQHLLANNHLKSLRSNYSY